MKKDLREEIKMEVEILIRKKGLEGVLEKISKEGMWPVEEHIVESLIKNFGAEALKKYVDDIAFLNTHIAFAKDGLPVLDLTLFGPIRTKDQVDYDILFKEVVMEKAIELEEDNQRKEELLKIKKSFNAEEVRDYLYNLYGIN